MHQAVKDRTGIVTRYGNWIESKPWHAIVAGIVHLSIFFAIMYVCSWACVEPMRPEGLRYTWSEWRERDVKRNDPSPIQTWQQESRLGRIEADIEIILNRCPEPITGQIEWKHYGDVVEIIHPDITLYHAMLIEESGKINKLLRMGYSRVEMRGDADRYVYTRD